jgi:hypothetical protein
MLRDDLARRISGLEVITSRVDADPFTIVEVPSSFALL